MTYNEALSYLDEPIGEGYYGNKMMVSETIRKHIFKSKYGLCSATNDWPAPFSPTTKDLEATDYIIATQL